MHLAVMISLTMAMSNRVVYPQVAARKSKHDQRALFENKAMLRMDCLPF